jgi:ElaB/YqjD/DUF883 family membrane-anchored ribosome-binding protein
MATIQTPARPAETAAEGDDSLTAVQKLREQADAVVQRIQPQIAAVSTYARDEPTKALLMAAATGAALMGIVALIVRTNSRPTPVSTGKSTMAAIRDAALDLADSAQSMAADALQTAQKRVADTISGTQKRAGDAQKRAADSADSVSETMADAWKKVRDQAAPVVDKIRPQIDAATDYVKEDPTRAALGLAAVGAIVAGLVALTRRAGNDDTYPY